MKKERLLRIKSCKSCPFRQKMEIYYYRDKYAKRDLRELKKPRIESRCTLERVHPHHNFGYKQVEYYRARVIDKRVKTFPKFCPLEEIL